MAYENLSLSYEAGLVSRCRGPFDLLVGPPGSGKSTVGRGIVASVNTKPSVKQPIRFWSFNLSRMSPLEFGFILIPDGKGGLIRKLPPHFELPREGDVIEWTEFGRSHPQIQAAFVDIMASGEIDGVELPWVFNYATSNDRIFRSSAMKDRFMVMHSPNPLTDANEMKLIANLIVKHAGLSPLLLATPTIKSYIEDVIGPTYAGFGANDSGAEVPAVEFKGWSTRHAIGRIQLRAFNQHDNYSTLTQKLIKINNELALEGELQYYVCLPKRGVDPQYLTNFIELERRMDEFAPAIQNNIRLNRVYIERMV